MDNPDAEQSGISEHKGEISSMELKTVIVEVEELLEKSRAVAPTKERHFIYRVSAPVRDLNAASYTPKVAAIGPYHRKECPKAVEDIKSHYLQLVLGEKTKVENENIVTEMSTLLKKTREYYAELTETVPNNEFLKMMLFDSCFIVEIIRRFYGKEEEEMHEYIFDDDPIFIDETTRSTIRRDLVLFENQLPFFVLQRFYDLTLRPQSEPKTKSGTLSFSEMALRFVSYTISGEYCHLPRRDNYEPKHLLGLLYDSLTCEKPRVWNVEPVGDLKRAYRFLNGETDLESLVAFLYLPSIIFSIFKAWPMWICGSYSSPNDNKFKLISCSTSLLEKGVTFEGSMFGDEGTLFDICFRFVEGNLEMSPLTINSNTKAVFLNLLAYERYCQPSDKKYVRDYMALMDCLVDSSDDVKILCKHGIFENSSRDNEEITKLFDRPEDDFINIDPKNFVYKETFQIIDDYCNRRWTHFAAKRSKWMAKLRAKYFDSPWALISLLAATFLLALTMVQTTYTVLSYGR